MGERKTGAYIPMTEECEKQAAETHWRISAKNMTIDVEWAESEDRWQRNKAAHAGW